MQNLPPDGLDRRTCLAYRAAAPKEAPPAPGESRAVSTVLLKHCPMRAAYLATQRMCWKSPMPDRMSSAVGPPSGAAQNQALCSRTCMRVSDEASLEAHRSFAPWRRACTVHTQGYGKGRGSGSHSNRGNTCYLLRLHQPCWHASTSCDQHAHAGAAQTAHVLYARQPPHMLTDIMLCNPIWMALALA